MKTKLLLIGAVAALFFYGWITRPVDEALYLPENFEGCAAVVYNIRGIPDLEIEKHTINYYFDEDGILLTNSPLDFGWEGRKTSGFSKTEYYYVHTNGDVSEIPIENIGPSTLGEYSVDGRVRLTSYTTSIGTMENACEDYVEKLDKLVDKKLKNMWKD